MELTGAWAGSAGIDEVPGDFEVFFLCLTAEESMLFFFMIVSLIPAAGLAVKEGC